MPAEGGITEATGTARPAPAELGALALILGTGAFLRLHMLEFAQFKADDITLWNLARAVLRAPRILDQGMESSFGPANGPFQVYMLLPGVQATSDPIGAYVLVALLNILGILLFWGFVRSFWGPRLALLAALVYATNPWAVVFSRRLWGNSMVPPFTTAIVWTLCALCRRGRWYHSMLPFLWLGVAGQLYIVAFIHSALLSLGFGLGALQRQVRWAGFLAGLGAFALLTAPYMLSQVIPGWGSIFSLFGMAGKQPRVDLDSIAYMFHLVSSEGYQGFANQAGGILDASSGLPYLVSRLAEVLLGLGLAVGALRGFRHLGQRSFGRAAAYFIPLTAVVLPPLLQVRHTSDIYPYHLYTGFPMHFFFVALGLYWLPGATRWVGEMTSTFSPLHQRTPPPSHLDPARAHLYPTGAKGMDGAGAEIPAQKGPAMRSDPDGEGTAGRISQSIGLSLAGAAILLMVGTHLVLAHVFFTAIPTYYPASNYGLPLWYNRAITDAARALVAQNGYTRVYVGGTEEHDSVLHRAIRHEIPGALSFSSGDALVSPTLGTGEALYILSSSRDRAGQLFSQQLAEAEQWHLDLPGEGIRYTLYGASPERLDQLLVSEPWQASGVRFDNRILLESFTVDRALYAAQPARLLLRWSVLPGPDPPAYFAFARLTDPAGNLRLALQLNDSSQWRGEERWVWWRDIPVPADLEPGVYTWRVGLFTSDGAGSYRNAVAIDTTGAILNDSVILGRSVVAQPAVEAPYLLSADLSDKVRLQGYDLPAISLSDAVATGKPLEIDLYWRSLREMDQDYTVFVHMVDSSGKLVAQHDSQPAGQRFPTSAWRPGETVVDRHSLALPPSLPPGVYQLRVGMYNLATGQRLGGSDAYASVDFTLE